MHVDGRPDQRRSNGQTICQLFTLARSFKRSVCLLIAVKSVLWNFTLSCFRTELSVLPIFSRIGLDRRKPMLQNMLLPFATYVSCQNNVTYNSLVRDPKIMLPRPNSKWGTKRKQQLIKSYLSPFWYPLEFNWGSPGRIRPSWIWENCQCLVPIGLRSFWSWSGPPRTSVLCCPSCPCNGVGPAPSSLPCASSWKCASSWRCPHRLEEHATAVYPVYPPLGQSLETVGPLHTAVQVKSAEIGCCATDSSWIFEDLSMSEFCGLSWNPVVRSARLVAFLFWRILISLMTSCWEATPQAAPSAEANWRKSAPPRMLDKLSRLSCWKLYISVETAHQGVYDDLYAIKKKCTTTIWISRYPLPPFIHDQLKHQLLIHAMFEAKSLASISFVLPRRMEWPESEGITGQQHASETTGDTSIIYAALDLSWTLYVYIHI